VLGKRKWVVGAVVAVLAMASCLGEAAEARASVPGGVVKLSGLVLSDLSHAVKLGGVAPNRPMNIGIGLADPDLAKEKALFNQIYSQSSPDYHHFLTPAQLKQRFAVPAARLNHLRSWLTDGHLRVDYVSPLGDYVYASGPAHAVESLFDVTIDRIKLDGQTLLANLTGPSVPAGLGIESVLGLNTQQKFSLGPVLADQQPGSTRNLAASLEAKLAGVIKGATTGLQSTLAQVKGELAAQKTLKRAGVNPALLTPQDLWSMYEMPSSDEGQGQTIGIFADGNVSGVVNDLATFEKLDNLPAVKVDVVKVGPGPYTDTSGVLEYDLDSQASTGMAPEVKQLDIFDANSLADASVELMFSDWVGMANGPMEASASFGECETDPLNPIVGDPVLDPPQAQYGLGLGDNLEPVAEQTLLQATLEGRTLFAAAGDTGSSCPVLSLPGVGAFNGLLNQGLPLQEYPAASPYAVAVGGTVLEPNSSYPPGRGSETAWLFTGGGSSPFIPAPSYQYGVPGIFLPCLTTSTGEVTDLGQLCRGVPDVAAMSGNGLNDAYSIVGQGEPNTGAGGTSLSTPLWNGMWARVQAASSNPGGNGFANPTFYQLGKNPSTYHQAFYNITQGLNGLFFAHQGWNYVSGWGSPNLASMIQIVDGTTSVPTSTAASSSGSGKGSLKTIDTARSATKGR
jgi:pseudomonalisin